MVYGKRIQERHTHPPHHPHHRHPHPQISSDEFSVMNSHEQQS